jgi:hypothetical protein
MSPSNDVPATTKVPRLAATFFGVGMTLVILGLFSTLDTRARGWFWVCGFSLLGVPGVFGLYPDPSRRRQLAQGFYMFVAGLTIGGGRAWPEQPDWLKQVFVGALLLSVAWFFVEARRAVALNRPLSAQLAAAPGWTRIIRYFVLALLVLLIPLAWFMARG